MTDNDTCYTGKKLQPYLSEKKEYSGYESEVTVSMNSKSVPGREMNRFIRVHKKQK